MFTKAQIEAMGEWVMDLGEDVDIDEMSDDEIIRFVKRNYDGGLDGFVQACDL